LKEKKTNYKNIYKKQIVYFLYFLINKKKKANHHQPLPTTTGALAAVNHSFPVGKMSDRRREPPPTAELRR